MRAPFVPQLKSITDTSYFPTEDLQGVPSQVVRENGGKAGMAHGGMDTDPSKDLAFVGYTFKRWETIRDQI